jgi:beta-glucosidase
VRELKGFEKISLQPGEAKDVSFTLDKRAFAYWNTELHDWTVEPGDFTIEIGRSSRDIALDASVTVNSAVKINRHYDMNSIFMDILADPHAAAVFKPVLDGMRAAFIPADTEQTDAAKEAITEEMGLAMFNYMPLRSILSFAGEKADPSLLEQLLNTLNTNNE